MDTAPRAAQSMTAALKGQPQTSMISHLVNVFFGYAPLAPSEESRRQDGAPGEGRGGRRRDYRQSRRRRVKKKITLFSFQNSNE